ncbi:unnamed protein product, partial [Urochloa humidicola]
AFPLAACPCRPPRGLPLPELRRRERRRKRSPLWLWTVAPSRVPDLPQRGWKGPSPLPPRRRGPWLSFRRAIAAGSSQFCSYVEEVKIREHGEKINKYQGMLAARLKAKYFSNKFFEKEDVFEEIVIQSETIRLSRWPFTRLFADPAKFSKEKSYTEKDISPSLVSAAMSNN